ncbi:MAG: hypothetical protein RL656_1354 [Bacteroidota bacterium]|jgi:hypothetical protein
MTNFNQEQTVIFLHYFSLEVVAKFREYPSASFIDILKSFTNAAEQKGIEIDFILPEMIFYELSLKDF